MVQSADYIARFIAQVSRFSKLRHQLRQVSVQSDQWLLYLWTLTLSRELNLPRLSLGWCACIYNALKSEKVKWSFTSGTLITVHCTLYFVSFNYALSSCFCRLSSFLGLTYVTLFKRPAQEDGQICMARRSTIQWVPLYLNLFYTVTYIIFLYFLCLIT